MKILRFAATAFLMMITTPSLFAQSQTPTPEDCACDDPPAVLASVGPTQILSRDLDRQTQAEIGVLKQEVVTARRKALDLQINLILLQLETKKQGLTTRQLLEKEVIAKTKEPTLAEVRAYYDKYATQSGWGSFETVQKSIAEFLRSENQQKASREFADRLRAANQVQKVVEFASPPRTPADLEKVLATVNGKPVKSSDIENSLKDEIFAAASSIYSQRKDAVDVRINDILLEAEAKKLGLTTAALLKREVEDKVPAVTVAEAEKYFNEHKDRINGTFADLKDTVIQYLTEERRNKVRQAFADRLRSATVVKYFISPPEPPTYQIATDGQPSLGPADAPVTVVEFVDFECPSCAAFHAEFLKVIDEFKGKIRVVMIDYPLSYHQNARKAAEAAEAAQAQGKYWEYISVLLKNHKDLAVPRLKSYAKDIGLNTERFDRELDSGKYAAGVDADVDLGDKIGVNATPTFFINGRQMVVITAPNLRQAIAEALARQTR